MTRREWRAWSVCYIESEWDGKEARVCSALSTRMQKETVLYCYMYGGPGGTANSGTRLILDPVSGEEIFQDRLGCDLFNRVWTVLTSPAREG